MENQSYAIFLIDAGKTTDQKKKIHDKDEEENNKTSSFLSTWWRLRMSASSPEYWVCQVESIVSKVPYIQLGHH